MAKQAQSPCIGICSSSSIGDDVCRGCCRTKHDVDTFNQKSDMDKAITNARAINRAGHADKLDAFRRGEISARQIMRGDV